MSFQWLNVITNISDITRVVYIIFPSKTQCNNKCTLGLGNISILLPLYRHAISISSHFNNITYAIHKLQNIAIIQSTTVALSVQIKLVTIEAHRFILIEVFIPDAIVE